MEQQQEGEKESGVEVVKRKQPTSSENQNDSVAGAEGSHSKRPKHVDDEQDESRRGAHATGAVVRRCPYLDTVNRALLDFDFEKVCRRGRGSHAYYHSLQADHHVFINLLNEKVYCLPDGYEVQDPSLDDIKVIALAQHAGTFAASDPMDLAMGDDANNSLGFFVLHPRYTRELVTKLDSIALPSHALDGSVYYPGVVGLNNIKNNDYINAVVHSLAHVRPLRDFFLLEENYRDVRTSPPPPPEASVRRLSSLPECRCNVVGN
ncbi:ubiquitin specific protease 39 and snrnp assembly factor, putative, partial [Acanthamoeba castellanii str. Neff]